MNNLEKESVDKICDDFQSRMIMQRVKFDSKDFHKRQVEFVAGTISVLNIMGYGVPALIGIMVMSNRPICEPYKL